MLRPDPQIFETLGTRDTAPEMGVHGARAERALRNSNEQAFLFLPLALLGLSVEVSLIGAQIFVLSRLAYVPVYILGVPVLRSALWALGVAGLAIMAAAVAG